MLNDPSYDNDQAPELDSTQWRHAMIPWKEGGRLYTYLIPPGAEPSVGDMALVEGPKGNWLIFPIAEITPHEPTQFQCKPIANYCTPEQYEELRLAEAKLQPADEYPEWKVQAADLFVEGL